jgi:hypothetical protein
MALVAAWTAWNRLTDFTPSPSVWLRRAILLLTFFVPLCALQERRLFVLLCGLNLVAYVVLIWRGDTISSIARELTFASFPLMFAGLPAEWRRFVFSTDNGTLWILLILFLYLAIIAFRVRHMSMAIIGGLTCGLATLWLLGDGAGHAAIQAALVYSLLHSLRWTQSTRIQECRARYIFAFLWLIDAFLWTRSGGWLAGTVVSSGSMLILTMWGLRWWCFGVRGSAMYPITAIAVVCCGPVNWFHNQSSEGVLALTASLVLFALGFFVAWTKRYWVGSERPDRLDSRDPLCANSTSRPVR